jgi:hypothetical protein
LTELSEIKDKLDELEKRVAGIKDYKQKYEDAERVWNKEKKKISQAADVATNLKELLIQFLTLEPTAGSGQPSTTSINLEERQLIVNVTHQDVDVNMTTKTVLGKILFCALTELPKEGFAESELAEFLKEHGWNISHTTLAPSLGRLVRDGHLVRLEGTGPTRYRLPGKVKMNINPG